MITLTKTQFINFPANRANEDKQAFENSLKAIAQIAGGFSVVDLNGGWVMADGSLCLEPIKRIEVGTNASNQVEIYGQLLIIAEMLINMGEEAVMLGTSDGQSQLMFAEDFETIEAIAA